MVQQVPMVQLEDQEIQAQAVLQDLKALQDLLQDRSPEVAILPEGMFGEGPEPDNSSNSAGRDEVETAEEYYDDD